MGGRDLREGGPGAGQGGAVGGDRRHERRDEGGAGGHAGLPRVGRFVGGGAEGPQGAGARDSEAPWWPTGTWASGGAAREVWPLAAEQRCWNHKTLGVPDRLPKREQAAAREMLRAAAKEARDAFADRYADAQSKAVAVLEDDWDRMTAFYDFPEKHWRHLRTTNVVESPFASVRLRTTAAKRFQAGRQRHGADLAAAAGGREAVPGSSPLPTCWGRVTREEVRGRKARPRRSGEDRRLMTFTHLLTRLVFYRDLEMATRAIELEGLSVTVDPVSRARGELAMASVIDLEAIQNQTATSLADPLWRTAFAQRPACQFEA